MKHLAISLGGMRANERISVSGYKVFYKSISAVILFQLSASENMRFHFLDGEEVVILEPPFCKPGAGSRGRKKILLIFPILSDSAQNKRIFNSLHF